MPSVLIVGATRGLGLSLANLYLSRSYTVHGTSRGPAPPDAPAAIHWLDHIDLMHETAADALTARLAPAGRQDVVIVSAGFFGAETLDAPGWDAQVRMYTTSAIAPVFVVRALARAGLVREGSKVLLVSSESGSITLRHASEGGGNYGHHASKAALNMVGKLLSLDLEGKGVAVGLVHPGFMRSEMTRAVGFDKYWDEGGAVEPDEAAESLADFIDTFDISKTGTFWAPRGARDIGTAEQTLGPKDKLPTPLQLPW